jgi:hypothetical protein
VPKTRNKKKTSRRKKAPLRQSKTSGFLKKIRSDNSMVEYFTQLRIMNPAAQLTRNLNQPRREGGFVRLAHARDEFTAPVLSKGKYALAKQAEAALTKKTGRINEKTGKKKKKSNV